MRAGLIMQKLVFVPILLLIIFLAGCTQNSGGIGGAIAKVTPHPVLSIGSVNYKVDGNILTGYKIPVNFVVSNSGDAIANNVQATVTLLKSGSTVNTISTNLGSINPAGTISGSVNFDIGRLEGISNTQYTVQIHVSSSDGATADY